MPPGRRPVQTIAVPLAEHPGWAERIWTRAAEEIEAGHQVFVVCPAIDADNAEPDESAAEYSPELDVEDGGETEATRTSVEWAAQAARAHPSLSGARIGIVHGRLPAEEKNTVMQDFATGGLDMLIATTVIEVGVDVPNASLMVIFDADRFGLSQLHQLRGRIGRGSLAGLCLLVTHAAAGTPGRARIDAVTEHSDGFELAQVDLDLRREGDVLGADQSGRRSSLRLLRVTRDADLIAEARIDARALIDAPGGLAASPAMAEAVRERLDDVERDFLARN
jgi:ATP-dependent DNA helicase RecG